MTGYVPADFDEGEMRYGVRSASDCESECWRESTCTRFVFITDEQLIGDPNRVCYLFSSRLATFIERPGGTIYFRRKCLPLDTCAAMTTTSTYWCCMHSVRRPVGHVAWPRRAVVSAFDWRLHGRARRFATPGRFSFK